MEGPVTRLRRPNALVPVPYPVCRTERSGLFKVGADGPHCHTPAHLVPAQDTATMVKLLAAPGFQMNDAGPYADRVQT